MYTILLPESTSYFVVEVNPMLSLLGESSVDPQRLGYNFAAALLAPASLPVFVS